MAKNKKKKKRKTLVERGAEFAVALFQRKAWRQENRKAKESKERCRKKIKRQE